MVKRGVWFVAGVLAWAFVAGNTAGRCTPVPIAPRCAAVDPGAYGACAMVLGVAFDGTRCVTVSGCSCGDDCDLFYADHDTCRRACEPVLGDGDICGDAVPGMCADGLVCCYPCGIQGCDWRCTTPCDESEPWCAGGCPMRP